MGMVFNAKEVFEIAEQLERNGYDFYKSAAEIAESPESKQFLFRMAEMEAEHESLFSFLKEKISRRQEDFSSEDLDGQAISYLQAMVEGKIFPAGIKGAMHKLTGKEKIEELLRIAIQFEKDAVVFFVGVRELVPLKFGKNKINDLIREEMGHIAILSRELSVTVKKKVK